MAYLVLAAAAIVTGALGRRDQPKLSGEGKAGLLGTLLSASAYSALTRQSPSLIASFLAFMAAVVLLVTRGHPKRALPNEFLAFDEGEATQIVHQRQEKIYGWVIGLILVVTIIYVIFFTTLADLEQTVKTPRP